MTAFGESAPLNFMIPRFKSDIEMCVSLDKRAHLPALIVVVLFAYVTKLKLIFSKAGQNLVMSLDVD